MRAAAGWRLNGAGDASTRPAMRRFPPRGHRVHDHWRNTVNKTPSLIAAALLAITAGAALAQSATAPEADAPPPPKPLDVNKDGVVDRSEAAAHPRLAARFDALDKDKDGKLDRSEMPRPPQGWHGRRGGDGHPFARLDTDKDGRVSKAEAASDPKFAERFAQMDANQDGYVDRADREQMMKQRRDEWFKSADGNHDGNLSKAEFDAAHARREGGDGGHSGWGHGPDTAK